MTFKHVKFEDSPIMRSLEKVAREKGLVNPEPILQKLASKPAVKKADIMPTKNLMENIFKLCEGLRGQGLVAEANELEINYLQYKQAQTLYETHKEKGEDQIHAAHPDGSHKLEGVEGDEAVFEDILDRHAKILQKIEKRPTGKLESTAHILSEVKKALGQTVDKKTQLLQQINAKIPGIKKLVQDSIDNASSEVSFPITGFWADWEKHMEVYTSSATQTNLKQLRDLILRLKKRLEPGLFGGISKDTWKVVNTQLGKALGLVAECLSLRSSYDNLVIQEAEHGVEPQQDPMLDKINAAQQSLNGIRGLVNADRTATPQDKQAIIGWLNSRDAELKSLSSSYKSMNEVDVEAELNKITADFVAVRKEWS